MVGLPVFHGYFSSSRTSSILSKDHPPDKKPKSDKTSLTCNEFDPTGNFHFNFQAHTPVLFFSFTFSFILCYILLFFILSLSLYASLYLTASYIFCLSLTHIFLSFSPSHTHKQTHSLKTIVLMKVCSMHKACSDGERWCVYLPQCFLLPLKTLIWDNCVGHITGA